MLWSENAQDEGWAEPDPLAQVASLHEALMAARRRMREDFKLFLVETVDISDIDDPNAPVKTMRMLYLDIDPIRGPEGSPFDFRDFASDPLTKLWGTQKSCEALAKISSLEQNAVFPRRFIGITQDLSLEQFVQGAFKPLLPTFVERRILEALPAATASKVCESL